MTKCIDIMLTRSFSDTPRMVMAPRMTGIGCYGNPTHLAQTLARALTRFGLSSSDVLTVGWRSDALRASSGRQTPDGQRHIAGGDAVVLLKQYNRVTGFFLSAAEGKPRLHVHMRNTGRDPGENKAR
jgi:hypothetical protein